MDLLRKRKEALPKPKIEKKDLNAKEDSKEEIPTEE
jgi:hypothetical protein